MHSTDRNNSIIEKSQPLQPLPAVLKRESSRKSASRVWTVAIQCRHRQTESRALHSSLMALPPSSTCFPRQSAKRIHSAPSLVSPAHKSTGLFLFAPPIQRARLSPQGDFMLYSTVPQPVDEDLVQRLREKGGL